jgi:hypothetical protein
MLSEGPEECPKCGTRLGNPQDDGQISHADIFWMSAYSIGIVLIPVVVILIISVLCILLIMLR